MNTSQHDVQQLLSALFEQDQIEHVFSSPEESLIRIKDTESGNNNQINISALSLESCDAQHLFHCYQLALNFGVPTARRAIALYQSGKIEHTLKSVDDHLHK